MLQTLAFVSAIKPLSHPRSIFYWALFPVESEWLIASSTDNALLGNCSISIPITIVHYFSALQLCRHVLAIFAVPNIVARHSNHFDRNSKPVFQRLFFLAFRRCEVTRRLRLYEPPFQVSVIECLGQSAQGYNIYFGVAPRLPEAYISFRLQLSHEPIFAGPSVHVVLVGRLITWIF